MQAIKVNTKLEEKTVIFDVVFHKPGLTRKGDLAKVGTDADKKRLSLGKRILDSKEYKAAMTVARKCRSYLRDIEVPGGMPLRTGMHRIPVSLIDAAYEEVKKYEAEFMERAQAFLDAYPALKAKAPDDLKSQYREADYPPVYELEEAFSVSRHLLDFGVPDADKTSSAIHDEEWQAAKEEAIKAQEDCKMALRAATIELVQGFANALGHGDGGKKHKLTAAGWKRAEDFLALYDKRNVLEDEECEKYVKAMKELVNGHDPEILRKDDAMRSTLEGKVKEVLAGMKTLVESKPRAFSQEDV